MKKYTILVALLAIVLSGCSKTKPLYPVTERKPVTDEYYGIKVTDDYRWLDDLNDPSVRKWVDAQNAHSRAYFDRTRSLAAMRDRLKQLYGDQSVEYSSLSLSKKLFALKFQPAKEQKLLVVMDSPENLQSERVVVDPNELNPQGTTAIDWFAASQDGNRVAVVLSDNGSENGSAHVFDVATGKELDVVPRVQYPTGGGSLEWDKGGNGFYYTRYPQGNERPKDEMNFYQQVYYHKVGTPANEDTYVTGKEFPKIAEIRISSGGGGKYLLVKVANGDGGDFMHYLRGPDGKWQQLTQYSDKVSLVSFGDKGLLYLLSRKDSPKGKILAVPLTKPSLSAAKTVVPETDVSIADFTFGKKYLYVLDIVGGPTQVRVFDRASIDQIHPSWNFSSSATTNCCSVTKRISIPPRGTNMIP
jgi:prolyl oligopeptidase